MSPFYIQTRGKEGDNWVQWDGRPLDLRTLNGENTGVSICSVPDDREQLQVEVSNETTVFARAERGNVIFPGGYEILNRGGVDVIKSSTGEIIAQVIYSKNPIK